MSCLGAAGVAFCGVGATLRREILRCPVCQCRREMVISYPTSPYYGPTTECTGCGDTWSDGERHERPFARGWRKQAVARVRERWAVATYGPPPTYDDWFEEVPRDGA